MLALPLEMDRDDYCRKRERERERGESLGGGFSDFATVPSFLS